MCHGPLVLAQALEIEVGSTSVALCNSRRIFFIHLFCYAQIDGLAASPAFKHGLVSCALYSVVGVV